jgi:hypothetical protein
MIDEKKFMKKALEVIKRDKLVFITDLINTVGVSHKWFWTTKRFHLNEEIMDALSANKSDLKINLRKKWENSPHPNLQISLYKLLSDEEELRKLSMQNVEQKTEQTVTISFVD